MAWFSAVKSERLMDSALRHCTGSSVTRTAPMPPGMACGVLHCGAGGRAEFQVGCAGQRQADRCTSACDVADRWHLGSNTKALTALLAAVCVQRGEFALDWTSTVSEVLGRGGGEHGCIETIHEGYSQVTLLELLSNSGGAPGSAPEKAWSLAWEHAAADTSPVLQRRAFVSALLALPPAAARGSYEYSNQGFAIAGHMLETAAGATSGQSYEELLTSLVFKPLGVRTAGFGAAPGSDSPWGHTREHETWLPKDPSDLNADNPPAITPAGCVHMGLEDYGRCLAPILSAQIAEEHLGLDPDVWRVLSRQIREPQVQVTADSAYALGWLVVNRTWAEDGIAMTHSGSNTMNYCTTWCVPEVDGQSVGKLNGVAILVACNAGGDLAKAAVDEACADILRSEIEKATKL